jgi:predicted MPP superfamily phosphohydrolase
MSLDLDLLIVVLALLGHVGIAVVATNIAHGLGHAERGVHWIRQVLLMVIIGMAFLIVRSALASPPARWPWLLQAYAAACLATVLIGLPATSLYRKYRRRPAGISGRAEEIDLAAAEAEGKSAFIGTGINAWLLRLPGNESLRLRTVEWEIDVPGLPDAWDRLSLAHLSDLHLAPCYRPRFFEAVADIVGAWDVDVVAFTGDLIDHDEAHDWIVPVLSRLRGRLGTFAVLGNHDQEHHPRRVRRAVERAGFTDVDGHWMSLEIEGSTLAVGGTSYPWGPWLDPEAMPEADFRLLLSHSPDQFPRAARWGVDLILSGHNHAGQIRLPLVGPIFMPSVYSRRFDRGFFRAGRTLLHVSQGIGGKHPVRYGGCLPEVTRLVLRPAASAHRPETRLRTRHTGQALDGTHR